MRLSETQLLQIVEKDEGNSLVLIDEDKGTEIEIPNETFAAFFNAIEYFWQHM